MSYYDGMGVDLSSDGDELSFDFAGLQECMNILENCSSTISSSKQISVDFKSTIAARSKAEININDMNAIRTTMGAYLDVDDSNLETIANIISGLDSSLAGN